VPTVVAPSKNRNSAEPAGNGVVPKSPRLLKSAPKAPSRLEKAIVYAGASVPRPPAAMNVPFVPPTDRPETVPVPSGPKLYVGPGTSRLLVTGVTAAAVKAARAPAPK
jgi:hypothetical protein